MVSMTPRLAEVALVCITTLFTSSTGDEGTATVTEVQLGMLTHAVLLSSRAGDCSGSVLSEDMVLTAAHCLVSIDIHHIFGRYRTFTAHRVSDDGVQVKAGVVNFMNADVQHRQERNSKEVILHPRFQPMKLGGFDIGLVRVSPPFNFSDVVFRVEVSEKGWEKNGSQGVACQSSGFGDTSNRQTAKLRLWDIKARHGEGSCPCTKRFQWKRLVCTELGDEPDLCSGDSGAALICEDKAVAISHMTRSRRTCGDLNYPNCTSRTLNTHMYLCPFNDWIRRYVPKAPPTPASCLSPFSAPASQYSLLTIVSVVLIV